MNTTRITRSRTDRMVAGVAGGLAASFGIDPLFVRLGFLVLTAINGLGALLYIALWLIVPNEDSSLDARSNIQVAIGEMQLAVEQLIERLRAAVQR
jgi:phage shock protein C